MKSIFFIFCIIEIIIQIVSIKKLKKFKNNKYWNTFVGITIASYISCPIAYSILIYEAADLGEGLLGLFICAFSFISNLILTIIGLINKKNIKNTSIKTTKRAFFVATLGIIINIIVIIIIPIINKTVTNKLIVNNVTNYLNNKYGDHQFEIYRIEKSYTYNGIIEADHTGYKVIILSPELKDYITLYIYGTNPTKAEIIGEDFIQKYYDEIINKYLLSKYNVEFDIWVAEENISNTFGKIPTFDELISNNAISNTYIIAKKNSNYNYDDNIDGRINYLKDLSLDLINYLNISQDFNIEFDRWNNQDSYTCNIEISNNTIKITDHDKKVYELDVSKEQ